MLAILCLRGVCLQTKHIASGVRLRNSQTDEFFSSQDIGDNFRLEAGISKIENGRKPNDFAAEKAISITTITAADKFLSDD
jgi:hypothetical protein